MLCALLFFKQTYRFFIKSHRFPLVKLSSSVSYLRPFVLMLRSHSFFLL